VSGVLTGIFAVVMSSGVQTLTEWRLHTVQSLLDDAGTHRVWVAFLWNWAFSCVLVVFGVALVSLLSKQRGVLGRAGWLCRRRASAVLRVVFLQLPACCVLSCAELC
jgi:hypothetical protein